MDWRYVVDKNVCPLKKRVLLFIDRRKLHQKIGKTFSSTKTTKESIKALSAQVYIQPKCSEYVVWPASRSGYGFIGEGVQKQARGPPEKPP